MQERNKRYVQIDAVGVGTASAAAPFLPVFLTRLGATPVQVGLLTSMPGITGFIHGDVGRQVFTEAAECRSLVQSVPTIGHLSICPYGISTIFYT